MSIGCINVPNARLKWMLTLMILAEVCFIMYVKIVNMKNTPDINRIWAMPHSLTFTIKPIRELINRYVKEGMIIIDAWANNSKIGTIRNDLNPEMDTQFHLDALEFLKLQPDNSADLVLYDPPYSISQATEMYKSFGKDKLDVHVSNMGYWGECKNQVARILKTDGVCIICGWSSNGIGLKRNFEMTEILLVPHGGSKNDTIVTVEYKRTNQQLTLL